MVAVWKQLRKKVRSKGLLFAWLFWFFFYMCVIPLLIVFLYSLFTWKAPVLVVTLSFIGFIAYDIYFKRLYNLSLLLVMLNFLLWFVFGVLSFVQNYFSWLPGYTAYFLLAPYAFVSGGMTHYLLWKSSKNIQKTMFGGVIISMMIAVVSASTDLIIKLVIRFNEGLHTVEGFIGAPILSKLIGGTFYKPVYGFFLILIMFNIAYIRQYLFARKVGNWGLLLYLIPIAIFFAFTILF